MSAPNSGPRVLFSTRVFAYPAVGGPYLRIENSVKALSRISELHIHCRIPLDDAGLAFYEGLCERLYFSPSGRSENLELGLPKRVWRRLARTILKRDVFVEALIREDMKHLLEVADTVKPDVIWLGYGNTSYEFLKYVKEHSDYKVVADTDSVWSRYVLRGLPFVTDKKERLKIEEEGKAKEEEERWGTRMADVTTAVSEVDAEYYRQFAGDPGRVHVFSNVIDVEAYRDVPPPAPGLRKPCIYLAGTFWPHSPMEDAARLVIDEILPLIRRSIPDVHLYIIGRGSDRTLADVDDPGISVAGEVASVLPYLCHADVALVPLRFESGTRFKILEAGACGIPVVSTTLGAEGIPVTHEKDILIADKPEEFAAGVVRLINDGDLARALAENLKELVSQHNSVAALAREGQRILEYLGAGRSV